VLEQELNLLRRHLLPASPNPTGTYAPAVYSRTHGYRVLAHAEFEYYFEERSKELCMWSVDRWNTHGKPSRIIAALLANFGSEMGKPKPTDPQWVLDVALTARIASANTKFHQLVDRNNGIKEDNLLKLLLPIGIDMTEVEPAWIATMEAFGRDRGSIAHRLASMHRLTSLPNPFDELETVMQILRGTKDLDEKLNALKR
jgi:hypothetical protein